MSASVAHTQTPQAPIHAHKKSTPQKEEHQLLTPPSTHSPLTGAFPPSAILSHAGTIQAKLTVGPVDDPYEREADAVAEQVVNGLMQANANPIGEGDGPADIQRKCAACEEEETLQRKPLEISRLPRSIVQREAIEAQADLLQAKPLGGGLRIQKKSSDSGGMTASPSISSQIAASRGGGSPLHGPAIQQMQQGFGRDFGGVRIHTDSKAAQLNTALNARAFTVGNDVFFGAGQYQPQTREGQRLLAHELTHTVQQGEEGPTIQRVGEDEVTLFSVEATLPHNVVFDGSLGTLQMYLDTDIDAGDYHIRYDATQALLIIVEEAKEKRFDVSLAHPTHEQARQYHAYIEFLSHNELPLTILEAAATPPPVEPAPPPTTPSPSTDPLGRQTKYLSAEEIKAQCESGNMPGVMVFPFRGTRFGAAPVMAERDGEYIRVKLPMYVQSDSNFKDQVRTLPWDAFIGGVRLHPQEIVRVRVYSPHWYQLNITGDASWDETEEFCVTGEQMLQIAEASTNATLMNIGLTVVDAATLFIPVGKLAQPLMRTGRVGLAATMIGTAEAVPVALGGAASRTTTVVVEQQIASQVGQIPIKQTVTREVMEMASEQMASHVGRPLASPAASTALGGAADATGRVGLAAAADTGLGQVAAPGALPTVETMVVNAEGKLITKDTVTPDELSLLGQKFHLEDLKRNGVFGATPRTGTTARPVLTQGKGYTCGPVSCAMAARTGDIEIRGAILEGMMRDFPRGAWSNEIVGLLGRVNVQSRAALGQTVENVATATSTGQPALVVIKTQAKDQALHWVVVDGVTTRSGVPVVAVRNPWGIQYFQELEAFRASMTGEVVFVEYWY